MALASSALMALVLAASLAGAWLWSARGYASEANAALQQAAGESPLAGDGAAAVAVAGPYPVVVSVNIIFTISTNAFSPIAPTRIHRIRQRGCAAFGA